MLHMCILCFPTGSSERRSGIMTPKKRNWAMPLKWFLDYRNYGRLSELWNSVPDCIPTNLIKSEEAWRIPLFIFVPLERPRCHQPGLITVDSSLKIMILTKENVASQVFAEHIIGLSQSSWIENRRLVNFMALQNQTTSNTKLDIPTAIATISSLPNK